MATKLLKQKNGQTWRPYWYGAFDVDGKRKIVNLGVKWQGTPPASGSLRDSGDTAFERSRAKAEAVLETQRDETHRKGHAANLVEKLIEAKTGERVQHIKIDGLADCWLTPNRLKKIAPRHAQVTRSEFKRFADFMAKHSSAVYLYEVKQTDVDAYAADLFENLAPRTARGHLALLRAAFKRFLPVGAANRFETVTTPETAEDKKEGTIHRRPFTAAELQALIEAAADDDLMRDLITAAACSGLRRGDLCSLLWEACDTKSGILKVKTSKTTEDVEIPMFEPMRAVLQSRKGNGSKYVFPEAARMMETNPQGLSYRFKCIAARALDTEPAEALPEVIDAAEIESEGKAAILANVSEGARRERILTSFGRYCKGETFRDIEKETKIPRGVISADLRAVETWTGKRFVRSVRGKNIKEKIARLTRTDRKQGEKAASVYDWHALRTTFVTLALSAGVPMELVQRVTGHKTVEIVLKHYFRPGRDEFCAAFTGALPDVITGTKTKPKALPPADELAAIAAKVAAGTATTKEKTRLKKLAAMI